MAAEKGNVDAQYRMGLIYEYGLLGHEQSDEEAFQFYKKSSKKNSGSMYRMARFYEKGAGSTKVDIKKAWDSYLISANKECGQAAYRVGNILEFGELGVTKDPFRSRCFYEVALRKGVVSAGFRLATLMELEFYKIKSSDHYRYNDLFREITKLYMEYIESGERLFAEECCVGLNKIIDNEIGRLTNLKKNIFMANNE